MGFDEFVLEDQPHASWSYSIWHREFLALVPLDAVVRFDRVEEDLYRLAPVATAVQAIETVEPLVWLNETSHRPWQELRTPRLAEVTAYRGNLDLWLGPH